MVCKWDKTPQLDGLPTEFFQHFWPLLGQDYVDVMNSCHASGCLSPSQRSGLITFVQEGGSPRDEEQAAYYSLMCRL